MHFKKYISNIFFVMSFIFLKKNLFLITLFHSYCHIWIWVCKISRKGFFFFFFTHTHTHAEFRLTANAGRSELQRENLHSAASSPRTSTCTTFTIGFALICWSLSFFIYSLLKVWGILRVFVPRAGMSAEGKAAELLCLGYVSLWFTSLTPTAVHPEFIKLHASRLILSHSLTAFFISSCWK